MVKENKKIALSNNKIFITLTLFYLILLLIIGFIASYYAYKQQRDKYLSALDLTQIQLQQSYSDIIENFWQLYMPIYEENNTVHEALSTFFNSNTENTLNVTEKRLLVQALKQILSRNNQVQWVAVYSDAAPYNYILFQNTDTLSVIKEDFPYLQEMKSKSAGMQIYGQKNMDYGDQTINTYAICGGSPTKSGQGKIIIGYNPAYYARITKSSSISLDSLNFILTSDGQIIYSSNKNYDEAAAIYLPKNDMKGVTKLSDGRNYYVSSSITGNASSFTGYAFLWKDLFLHSIQSSLGILKIIFVFVILSIILYTITLKIIIKEVRIIQDGLKQIGENRLDYRIPTNFKQNGLPEIAESINHMTIRLKENINRAYQYELRQKEAELSELQAKFNPHFLYNSLEMLRSRCHQNGDAKTAELITQLAAIFRGFIGSKTFIPLQEELTFSQRYLTLFSARYSDKVQIKYNFDREILKYGIIRNVFQLLIENYFVHGFDTGSEDNYILLSGKSLDDKTMILTVQDNGCGMTDEEIDVLNAKLNEPIQLDTESYGLKNLHQRLRLFYGDNCGLNIIRNETKGISVHMTVLKMTCEEYEKSKSIN